MIMTETVFIYLFLHAQISTNVLLISIIVIQRWQRVQIHQVHLHVDAMLGLMETG